MNGEKMIIDEHPTNDQRHQEVLNRSVVFKLTQEKTKSSTVCLYWKLERWVMT